LVLFFFLTLFRIHIFPFISFFFKHIEIESIEGEYGSARFLRISPQGDRMVDLFFIIISLNLFLLNSNKLKLFIANKVAGPHYSCSALYEV